MGRRAGLLGTAEAELGKSGLEGAEEGLMGRGMYGVDEVEVDEARRGGESVRRVAARAGQCRITKTCDWTYTSQPPSALLTRLMPWT